MSTNIIEKTVIEEVSADIAWFQRGARQHSRLIKMQISSEQLFCRLKSRKRLSASI